ncbi:MAG TPA: sulfite exporter TauE/SafE family protein [Candidatus Acidoferrales bacterium]|nr:sulfite exporter TauE/SafE family protein [Candidatus Acidoferrales bacterium]
MNIQLNALQFTLVVALASFLAGMLGSLTGLGGGVVIVPLLTLVFGVDIRYAIGASLVSVIATSSGAAAAYLREGYSNMRVGMFLEIATTVGAVSGAFLAAYLHTSIIAIVFGLVLLYSAYASTQTLEGLPAGMAADRIATILRLDGSYPTADGFKSYHVRRVPLGFGLMYVAGVLSGLLGIGSGAVKVLAMDQAMKIPFKVSTTTSNFMIGVTAAASAGIYLRRGYIDPGLAMPVMLGVLAGALVGAKILPGAKVRTLRIVFGVVIAALAIEMIFQGVRGKM